MCIVVSKTFGLLDQTFNRPQNSNGYMGQFTSINRINLLSCIPYILYEHQIDFKWTDFANFLIYFSKSKCDKKLNQHFYSHLHLLRILNTSSVIVRSGHISMARCLITRIITYQTQFHP